MSGVHSLCEKSYTIKKHYSMEGGRGRERERETQVNWGSFEDASVCSFHPLAPPFQHFLALLNSLTPIWPAQCDWLTLPLTSLFWKYASPSRVFFFFFVAKLEVCAMRLRDRFLTHGGLAL